MYDDINYSVGEYGVTFNKGTSHHNGAKSIDTVLKTKAYLRIRLGIGKNGLVPVTDYVLGLFSKEERELLKNLAKKEEKMLDALLEYSPSDFLNKVSLKKD